MPAGGTLVARWVPAGCPLVARWVPAHGPLVARNDILKNGPYLGVVVFFDNYLGVVGEPRARALKRRQDR